MQIDTNDVNQIVGHYVVNNIVGHYVVNNITVSLIHHAVKFILSSKNSK